MGARFWLRWSLRDLRRRWAVVAAIAAVIALGSGLYAGLGSTTVWRRQSLDATFGKLHADDIRLQLVGGQSLPAASLLAAVRSALGDRLSAVETRLVVEMPVSVATHAGTVEAAGVIVGATLPASVDRWALTRGHALRADASGQPQVLLDQHFADHHALGAAGALTVAQRVRVRYVGLALSPEYLTTEVTSGEAVQGPATRAVIYTSLATAQALAGMPGRANDAAIRLRAGVDARLLAAALPATLARTLPGVAVTATAFRSDPATRSLYQEISSEQRIYTVIAVLMLVAAGFAAFNLTRRLIDSQRREIGIGMSLGLSRSRIMIRPFLFAAEITVAGALLGVLVGWGIASWVLSVIESQQPLPVWRTPLQLSLFAQGALLALLVPLAASLPPIWRTVRTEPVQALSPAHLLAGRGGLANQLRALRLPGRTTLQAPPRRILRAPTRSLLTVVALALVIAPLLAALGATDSTSATVAAGQRFLTGGGSRVFVDLTTFVPRSAPLIGEIRDTAGVAAAVPGINIGGQLSNGATPISVSISMVDLRDPVSAPAAILALRPPTNGIIISAKAAGDLHVHVGSRLTLTHPLRVGTGFRFVSSRLPVVAVDDSPYRFVAYMDISQASLMGLGGLVNTVRVKPAPAAAIGRLEAALSRPAGVASALSISALSATMRDTLALVNRLFIILQVVIGVLAFLVAFNTSHLATEERRRENATMFAFGTSVASVVTMAVAESLILGVVGVGIGLGLGAGVLRWMLGSVFPAAVPDLAVQQATAAGSYLLALLIGLAACATAPLLSVRRLRTMNIPDALRYVE